MNEKGIKRTISSNKMILIAFGLGVIYWILESLIHHYLNLHQGPLIQAVFSLTPNELWMRLTVLGLLTIFGFYAQSTINRRTQEEARLQQSQAEFSAVWENAPIVMVLVDEERRVVKVNRAAAEFAGRPVEEMIGLRGGEALRCLHSLDDPRGCGFGPFCEACQVRNIVLDTLKTGKNHHDVEAQLPFATKQGEITLTFLASTTLLSLAAAQRVLVCLEDITKRKLAETMLQLEKDNFLNSLDSSPLGIRIITAEGELLYSNQAILDIYGYNIIEELKATPTKQRYTPESYTEYQERKERRRLGKPVPDNYEISIVRKDGEVRHLAVFRREVIWSGETQFQVIYQDITKRKQAEERINHLNRTLRAIRNVNQLITREKDRDRLLKQTCEILTEDPSCHNAWIALLDESGALVTATEAGLGKDFLPLSEKLKRGELPDCVTRAVAQSEAVIIEDPSLGCTNCPLAAIHGGSGRIVIRLEHDGKVYGTLCACTPLDIIRDDEEIKLFQEVVNDIAFALHDIELAEERQRAEAEIAKFKTLADNTAYGVAIGTTEGNLLYVNEGYARMHGYIPEELIGNQWSILYPEEQRKTVARLRQRMLETGNNWIKEIWRKRKDGSTFPSITTGVAVRDSKGKISYLAAIVIDITERKQAEEALKVSEARYQDLYDNAPDMYVSVDPITAEILRCNQTVATNLGYTKREIIGRPIFDMYHPDCMDDTKSAFQSFVETGEVHDAELQLKRKDGTKIDVSLNVSAVRDDQGNILYCRSAWRDITQRKRAEEEIKKSHEELRNLTAHLRTARETERTNIAREIHDELGQALTVLKMELAWLGKRLPEEQEQLREKVAAMTNQVSDTIRTVKRISTQLRPAVLDDLGLAVAIEWQAGEFQERTGIKCRVKLRNEDIRMERETATAVFRIYQEALTNVARHAGATRVNVSLTERGSWLVLRVKDNGIGIKEEQIADGRSVGIIGMRERALFRGGRVSIRGVPGKGTTVTVTIPQSGKEAGDDKNTGGR